MPRWTIPAEQARQQTAGLAVLAAQRASIEASMTAEVARLRPNVGWQQIGDALGVTPQAAQQRYGRRAQS
jgi:hypothetical protein